MSIANQDEKAVAEVRQVVEAWLEGIHKRDGAAVAALCAPEVLAFDAHSAFQFRNRDEFEKHLVSCMGQCPPSVTFDLHDIHVEADENLAFSHHLFCARMPRDGKELVVWTRGTMCLRKVDGEWKVVHGHASSPYDLESGKAMLELQP